MNHRIGYVRVDGDVASVAWDVGVDSDVGRAAVAPLGIDIAASGGSGGDASLASALTTIGQAMSLQPPRDIIVAAQVRGDGSVCMIRAAAAAVAAAVAAWPEALVLTGDRTRDHAEVSVSCDAEDLRTHGVAGTARGVESLSEALDVVFAFRDAARRGALVRDEYRERAETRLFAAVIGNARFVLDWSTVAALALGLLRERSPDAEGTWELEVVHAVAQRHDGITAPIAWPEPEQLDRHDETTRLELVAHLVQSVADGELSAVPEYVEHALRVVGGVRSPAALKTIGACGRALAAVGLFDQARDRLTDAFAGWLEVDRGQSSYSLCELLRVTGILGNRTGVLSLVDTSVPSVLEATAPGGRSFVRLAVGRALVQVGESRRALEWLESPDDDGGAPVHVLTSRARWLATAARQLSDTGRMASARTALERLDGGDADQRWLADLDDAISGSRDVEAPLTELLGRPVVGDEARRTLARIAPGCSPRVAAARAGVVQRLLSEYRY